MSGVWRKFYKSVPKRTRGDVGGYNGGIFHNRKNLRRAGVRSEAAAIGEIRAENLFHLPVPVSRTGSRLLVILHALFPVRTKIRDCRRSNAFAESREITRRAV